MFSVKLRHLKYQTPVFFDRFGQALSFMERPSGHGNVIPIVEEILKTQVLNEGRAYLLSQNRIVVKIKDQPDEIYDFDFEIKDFYYNRRYPRNMLYILDQGGNFYSHECKSDSDRAQDRLEKLRLHARKIGLKMSTNRSKSRNVLIPQLIYQGVEKFFICNNIPLVVTNETALLIFDINSDEREFVEVPELRGTEKCLKEEFYSVVLVLDANSGQRRVYILMSSNTPLGDVLPFKYDRSELENFPYRLVGSLFIFDIQENYRDICYTVIRNHGVIRVNLYLSDDGDLTVSGSSKHFPQALTKIHENLDNPGIVAMVSEYENIFLLSGDGSLWSYSPGNQLVHISMGNQELLYFQRPLKIYSKSARS